MLLTLRERFTSQDAAWAGYISFSKNDHLREVRSVDGGLNPVVRSLGDVASFDELMTSLQAAASADMSMYLQIAVNVSAQEAAPFHPRLHFLGCDVADSTLTSSLLNCGPLDHELLEFRDFLNEHGLLTHDQARAFQTALLARAPDDPHSHTAIFMLYEVICDGQRA